MQLKIGKNGKNAWVRAAFRKKNDSRANKMCIYYIVFKKDRERKTSLLFATRARIVERLFSSFIIMHNT